MPQEGYRQIAHAIARYAGVELSGLWRVARSDSPDEGGRGRPTYRLIDDESGVLVAEVDALELARQRS